MKNTREKIKNKFKEIYEKKIDINNMILKRLKKENIIYNLVSDESKQNEILGNINTYIPDFMHQLWENPKSIATILLNSDKNDIKDNLAHFIVHNLYDNLSSLKHKDEQLIYIISLLLKDEINSLYEINNFQNKTISEIIFGELNKKKEVKLFFKNIILDIIKKLESDYSLVNISFEPEEIKQRLEKLNILKFDDNFKKDYRNFLNKKVKTFNVNDNKEKLKLVNDKYINLPFNKNELNKKLLEFKDKKMKDFINSIIIECSSSPDKYLNNNIFSGKFEKDEEEKIINYYKNSFIQVIDIIDMLFDKLLNNSDLLPYSIKCICKIISILINKKFPKYIKVEQNKFLANFFFKILFFPIIIEFSSNNFINEIIISNLTIKKLNIIVSLLNNIVFGKIFSQKNLTSFNWYIIDKMPKIFEFLNNICQVELPPFIEKLINDELPENYEYNYFKENPDEDIIYRNILYTIDELYSLIDNALNCKNNININTIILTNLQKNIKKLKELKYNLQYEECNEDSFLCLKRNINCFLLSDSINIKKIDKILSLEEYNKNHFFLKELENNETQEDKIKNNIIKIKNYFYALLYNYETLSKTDFKKDKLNDIISILNQLKNYSFMNSPIYINNNYIPSNWYINSLIESLPMLPKYLIENDYDELLNELENDINNSIKEINFGELSIFINYSNDIDKEGLYYENIKNIIYDIELNEKALDFIENKVIKFSSKSDDKASKYLRNKMKENKEFSNLFDIHKDKNNNHIFSNTIISFSNKFPNISNYLFYSEDDFFYLLNKKEVAQIIENYMILIKKKLKNDIFMNEKNQKEIYYKIYDYIMEQIYDKLFPKEIIKKDIEISKNCHNHIWIEFHNLVKEKKNYIFDNNLPDSINYFIQFEKEKSPRKKLLCINNLFNCIYNLAKFNGDKIKGADDEFPLLNFILIKSKPKKIYSNCKYVQLFLGKNQNNIEGNYLTKILIICENISKLSFKDLYNINESDYILNCELVSKGFLY